MFTDKELKVITFIASWLCIAITWYLIELLYKSIYNKLHAKKYEGLGFGPILFIPIIVPMCSIYFLIELPSKISNYFFNKYELSIIKKIKRNYKEYNYWMTGDKYEKMLEPNPDYVTVEKYFVGDKRWHETTNDFSKWSGLIRYNKRDREKYIFWETCAKTIPTSLPVDCEYELVTEQRTSLGTSEYKEWKKETNHPCSWSNRYRRRWPNPNLINEEEALVEEKIS